MSVKSLFQACAGVAVALMGARLPAATRVVDKFHGPYYTIQAAVEAAEAGETVFVRNGIHDVGGALDGFSTPMSNRVYVAKSLTLVGESKEGAVIKGAHATEEVDDKGLGCGANAVRCLGINADNVVVSNLTLTGGATHNTTAGNDKEENNGGGVYVANGRTGVVLVDCIVSNNVARRAVALRYGNDGAVNHGNCLLVRTWVHDNKAVERDPAVRGCLAAHCLFTRHYSSATMTYAATFVNCTFADGFGRNHSGSVNVRGYNCLFADTWFKDDGKAQWFNCAFNKQDATTTSTTNAACVFNPGYDLFMAPPLVDYRLHDGATVVIGKGNATYLEQVPEAYRTTDFYGHAVDTASVSLGCAQEVVTPTGGTITFAGKGGMTLAENAVGSSGTQLDGGLYFFNGFALAASKRLGYIRTLEGRTVVSVTHDASVATDTARQKGLHSFTASGADTMRRYANADGTFVFVAPTVGKALTLAPNFNAAVLHVDRAATAAAPDGTETAPYASLQTALEAVPSGTFATVYVKAGVYDNGTMTQTKQFGNINTTAYTHKARAVVPENVSVVGAGAETTFIVGADDPSADAADKGCGPNAVRCVALAKGARLSGFTLTGGRTDVGTTMLNNGDDFHGGGVLAEFGTVETLATVTDCVISNCVARRGGGGFHGGYNRVSFLDNSVLQGGNGPAVRGNGAGNCFLANCVIDRNEGYATVYYPTLLNCTFGADNTQNGNKDGMVLIADSGDIRNCLFLGKNSAIGKTNAAGEVTATRFYDCVFSPQMKAYLDKQNAKTDGNKVFVDASCTATTELAVADDLTPVIGANAAVDAANADGYDAATWGEMDVHGNPRRVNGRRLDVGAVEADWKAAYSAKLGRYVTVTAADPEVELVADGVSLPAGASLAATFGFTGHANNTYVLKAAVAGNACAVTRDGEPAVALKAGVSETWYKVGATGLSEFAFTSDALGATLLSSLQPGAGSLFILR